VAFAAFLNVNRLILLFLIDLVGGGCHSRRSDQDRRHHREEVLSHRNLASQVVCNFRL